MLGVPHLLDKRKSALLFRAAEANRNIGAVSLLLPLLVLYNVPLPSNCTDSTIDNCLVTIPHNNLTPRAFRSLLYPLIYLFH